MKRLALACFTVLGVTAGCSLSPGQDLPSTSLSGDGDGPLDFGGDADGAPILGDGDDNVGAPPAGEDPCGGMGAAGGLGGMGGACSMSLK